jgi:hypothetical protein
MYRKYVVHGYSVFEMKSPEMLKELIIWFTGGYLEKLSFDLNERRIGSCYDLNEMTKTQAEKIISNLK